METRALETALSEDIIKKVTLRFFRNYYKFRLRYEGQPVVARYDLEGVGGIIADGYYSFKKTDGRPFIATFEATSMASRDEVLFKTQRNVLFWDGVASACLFSLFLVSLNYFYEFDQLLASTVWIRVLMLLLTTLSGFTVFYLIARHFRRYRYIYAIEQFKKYHADEQWIALADDVFVNSNDKYFRELKNQCVFNGFGLLLVTEKLDTKILVTPSRQDIFMGKRRSVSFLPQAEAKQQKIQQQFGIGGLMRSLVPEFMQPESSLLRFRKTYYTQMAVTGGCIFLIGFIMMRELQESGYQVVDEQQFRTDIAQSKSNNVPEQEEYLGDTAMTSEGRSMEQEEFNSKIWHGTERTESRSETAEPAPAAERPPSGEELTEIVINSKGSGSIAYDCTRFYNFDSNKYIIEEGVYDRWQDAEWRLTVLRRNEIPSAALLLQCFSTTESGYVVYIGELYNSPEEASQHIEALDHVPKSIIKDYRQLKIRTITPALR